MKNTLLPQFSGFIETPQIWDKVPSFPYAPFEMRKVKLESTPLDLQIPPTMVLGKRMEQFFSYYVTHFSNEKVLAHSEQIIHEKQTLGELDFLLRNKETQEVSHVELVYKFYLYDPNISAEDDHWTGPNHRDSLKRKLTRLVEKQFPLLHRIETLPLLQKIGLNPEEIVQKICFKANFFVPWDYEKEALPDGNSGTWMRALDFDDPYFHQHKFYSPRKQNWPIHPRHNTTWFSYEEIKKQVFTFIGISKSPLVWMKTGQGEYKRFFVVWW